MSDLGSSRNLPAEATLFILLRSFLRCALEYPSTSMLFLLRSISFLFCFLVSFVTGGSSRLSFAPATSRTADPLPARTPSSSSPTVKMILEPRDELRPSEELLLFSGDIWGTFSSSFFSRRCCRLRRQKQFAAEKPKTKRVALIMLTSTENARIPTP